MNERNYFGTDGVRGVAGEFPLTPAWVMSLGAAAGEVLKQNNTHAKVLIGKDTRQSSDMLEAALTAGLTSRGITVIKVGILPTPGVSYLTRHFGADAGVVISASHNPYPDNGIKFFGKDGQKLSDTTEHEIEAAIDKVANLAPVTGALMGTATSLSEAEDLYTHYLCGQAPALTGLRIAIDCANGAAYRIAPKVFQAAGAEVFAIYTTPNGRNINLNCGSTHLDHLQQIVSQGPYDLGVAFDGDADRALFVDSRGNIVHGDHMLLINARAREDQAVVATVMTNMSLEVKLREAGIPTERTAVGDRYVYERLQAKNLTLGGEQSGHILFLDVAPTGDGILTALLTLSSMKKLGTTLDQIYDELAMFPQTLVNIRVCDKRSIFRDETVQSAVKEAEKRLKGRGRVNLRPSGTENLIRIMVEGPDTHEIHEIAQHLSKIVEERSKVSSKHKVATTC